MKTAPFLEDRFQVGACRMPFGHALIESRGGFPPGLSDLIAFESDHDYIGDRTVFTVRKPVDKIMGLALRAKSRGLAVDNSFLTYAEFALKITVNGKMALLNCIRTLAFRRKIRISAPVRKPGLLAGG